MHKLKNEVIAIRKIKKDHRTFRSEEGIFLGRPARKNRVITEPPHHLNRAYAIPINTYFYLLFDL